MSANYTLQSRPPDALAAHREANYTYTGYQTQATFVDEDGYVRVIPALSFGVTPVVGERVYIASGIYRGTHIITEILGSTFVLGTAFISAELSFIDIYLLRSTTFSIYKGWAQGELVVAGVDFYDIQPRTLIAQFTPEPNLQGQFTFDISGYLKAAIPTPYRYQYNPNETNKDIQIIVLVLAFSIITENFTKIELMCEGNLEHAPYVYNSAYSQEEFNRYFVGTSIPMRPVIKAFTFPFGIGTTDTVDPVSGIIIRV